MWGRTFQSSGLRPVSGVKEELSKCFLDVSGMKIIHFKVNAGLLYWSECVILIVMLLSFEVKKKKKGGWISYCFVLTLFRWFQNINFLFRDSQPPSLSSFSSLLYLFLLSLQTPCKNLGSYRTFLSQSLINL